MMTTFQSACRDAVVALLLRHRLTPTLDVRGVRERYIVGEVPGGITLYIYEDGAEVVASGDRRRLEREDFDSLDELQRSFLEELERVITAPSRGREGSRPA
jgi:hypothetical protein